MFLPPPNVTVINVFISIFISCHSDHVTSSLIRLLLVLNCCVVVLNSLLGLFLGFMLPDLPEQFGPPDTAPALLSRLMEAVETKGTKHTNKLHNSSPLNHHKTNKYLLALLCEKTWTTFPVVDVSSST